jgi:hypothetical protein
MLRIPFGGMMLVETGLQVTKSVDWSKRHVLSAGPMNPNLTPDFGSKAILRPLDGQESYSTAPMSGPKPMGRK